MKLEMTAVGSIIAPSVGPAVITIFGSDFPVLAIGTSCAGLLLARVVAPPPLRKLTIWQESALTLLLLLITGMIVIGEFSPSGNPMAPGMAAVWGIGLGFSGLLVVEFFGDKVMAGLRAMFGRNEK